MVACFAVLLTAPGLNAPGDRALASNRLPAGVMLQLCDGNAFRGPALRHWRAYVDSLLVWNVYHYYGKLTGDGKKLAHLSRTSSKPDVEAVQEVLGLVVQHRSAACLRALALTSPLSVLTFPTTEMMYARRSTLPSTLCPMERALGQYPAEAVGPLLDLCVECALSYPKSWVPPSVLWAFVGREDMLVASMDHLETAAAGLIKTERGRQTLSNLVYQLEQANWKRVRNRDVIARCAKLKAGLPETTAKPAPAADPPAAKPEKP
jgi:hypothetical protein